MCLEQLSVHGVHSLPGVQNIFCCLYVFTECQEDLEKGPLPRLGEKKRGHGPGRQPLPPGPQDGEEKGTQHWTGWEDERGGYSICDPPRQGFGMAGVCLSASAAAGKGLPTGRQWSRTHLVMQET